jgi:hypothetical protein
LTSGTPVTTSDVTGAGTLYFTPYIHNRVALYNGSKWVTYSFTERSLALTLTSGKNYDVFLYDNSGTLTLELSAAWTNDTTRADALTTQDGVYVKSGSTGRLYLGTIRASGTNTTEDSYGGAHQSGGKRYVWNNYNRVRRSLGVIDTTDTWTYTTATWRQVQAASGNKVEYVCGIAGDLVNAVSQSTCNPTGAGNFCVGVGVDSTSVNSAKTLTGGMSNNRTTPLGIYMGYPSIGYHALNWLEISTASGTTTWFGDNGVTYHQSGMQAEVMT